MTATEEDPSMATVQAAGELGLDEEALESALPTVTWGDPNGDVAPADGRGGSKPSVGVAPIAAPRREVRKDVQEILDVLADHALTRRPFGPGIVR